MRAVTLAWQVDVALFGGWVVLVGNDAGKVVLLRFERTVEVLRSRASPDVEVPEQDECRAQVVLGPQTVGVEPR
jgi:hypothetical protein